MRHGTQQSAASAPDRQVRLLDEANDLQLLGGGMAHPTLFATPIVLLSSSRSLSVCPATASCNRTSSRCSLNSSIVTACDIVRIGNWRHPGLLQPTRAHATALLRRRAGRRRRQCSFRTVRILSSDESPAGRLADVFAEDGPAKSHVPQLLKATSLSHTTSITAVSSRSTAFLMY